MKTTLVGWSLLPTMVVVGGLASPLAGQVAAQSRLGASIQTTAEKLSPLGRFPALCTRRR